MSSGAKPSLAEQRQALRSQLRLQREVVALQLVPAGGLQSRFPRSLTMRLLIGRPELAASLVKLLAGPRFAAGVAVAMDLCRQLPRRRKP